jgi:hypothetical protein
MIPSLQQVNTDKNDNNNKMLISFGSYLKQVYKLHESQNIEILSAFYNKMFVLNNSLSDENNNQDAVIDIGDDHFNDFNEKYGDAIDPLVYAITRKKEVYYVREILEYYDHCYNLHTNIFSILNIKDIKDIKDIPYALPIMLQRNKKLTYDQYDNQPIRLLYQKYQDIKMYCDQSLLFIKDLQNLIDLDILRYSILSNRVMPDIKIGASRELLDFCKSCKEDTSVDINAKKRLVTDCFADHIMSIVLSMEKSESYVCYAQYRNDEMLKNMASENFVHMSKSADAGGYNYKVAGARCFELSAMLCLITGGIVKGVDRSSSVSMIFLVILAAGAVLCTVASRNDRTCNWMGSQMQSVYNAFFNKRNQSEEPVVSLVELFEVHN